MTLPEATVTASEHWQGIIQAMIVGGVVCGIACYCEGYIHGKETQTSEMDRMRERIKRYIRMDL